MKKQDLRIVDFWRDFCCNGYMVKKYALLVFCMLALACFPCHSQELRIKKGSIVDSLMVADSIQETFAVYLPRKFELKGKWPLLLVFDMQGRGKKGISGFTRIADSLGYVVASPNAVHDSVALTENILRTKRVLDKLLTILPVHRSRLYTAGVEDAGRFANLVPMLIREIDGAVSINAALANIELLNAKNPFHFIGIVQRENYNYPALLQDEKVLNSLKFSNSILVHDGKDPVAWELIYRALHYFELSVMARNNQLKDSLKVERSYQRDIDAIREWLAQNKTLLANRAMAETLSVFRTLRSIDSLREAKRALKRSRGFRERKRQQGAAFFKEGFLKEDFTYFLEEDVLTYNFNNLGWWNYQMGQIDKFIGGTKEMEQRMGKRLHGYVNALVKDNIEVVTSKEVVDEEALVFLYMLKTLTDPQNYDYYLKVASIASKNEDFGTALYYLEEALKKGFKDKNRLYAIEHTALLRITPEFNALVDRYFDESRY